MVEFSQLSRGQLLLASPIISDPMFERALIYLCEHQPEGSVGLIINKPLVYRLDFIFKQLGIEGTGLMEGDRPVLFGGPVHADRGFVLHQDPGHWHSSIRLTDDVTITTSNDIIKAFSEHQGPEKALILLGSVSWGQGQLMQECAQNQWFICKSNASILYDTPFEDRWNQMAASLKINHQTLIGANGHA